jgi:hypothetical protein
MANWTNWRTEGKGRGKGRKEGKKKKKQQTGGKSKVMSETTENSHKNNPIE